MAKTTNKNISEIEKKVVTPLEKINFDNINFGDIEMDEDKNTLVLSDESSFNNIISELQTFITELKKAKNDYTQNKINEIIIDKLNSGGNDADAVKKLFGSTNDKTNENNQGIKENINQNDSKEINKDDDNNNLDGFEKTTN